MESPDLKLCYKILNEKTKEYRKEYYKEYYKDNKEDLTKKRKNVDPNIIKEYNRKAYLKRKQKTT
jgi:hypothetical protein